MNESTIPTMKEARSWLLIDKHNLDEELIRQSQKYEAIGRASNKAISERDAVKDERDRVHAARSKYYFSTLEKPTADKVKAEVETDAKFLEESNRFAECKLEADNWQVMLTSFQQRASMLKHLCELYLGSYFVRGSVSGGSAKEASSDSIKEELSEARLKHRKRMHQE